MKMNQATKTTLAVVVMLAAAIAFWMLLIAPKREEASELSSQANTLRSEVSTEQARADAGAAAKHNFAADYQELIQLGKAVPNNADTASLLVQLNQLGRRADTSFRSISLSSSGGSEGSVSTEEAGTLQPIGAAPGPDGLSSMPYELEFSGGFFNFADFIHSVDAQVETVDGKVDAEGRLITIDGFTLEPHEGKLSSQLEGVFRVTTYVTPPGEGLTGGATPPVEEAP
jgi:Tfp pilus assembly protein PilO